MACIANDVIHMTMDCGIVCAVKMADRHLLVLIPGNAVAPDSSNQQTPTSHNNNNKKSGIWGEGGSRGVEGEGGGAVGRLNFRISPPYTLLRKHLYTFGLFIKI